MKLKVLNKKNSLVEQRSWAMSHLPELASHEIKILLNILRTWFHQEHLEADNHCNVHLLWEYATRHGLGGLIGSLAFSGKVDNSELISLGQHQYFSNILHYEQCLNICYSLQAAAISLDIPIAFIKGVALNVHAYKDPGDRSFSDIDILVESRADAWKLIHAVKGNCNDETIEESIYERLFHPGRIHAYVQQWELEFCYPINQLCEPMFDIIEKHKNHIMRVPSPERILTVPDPNVHMIWLIQHLAKHLCSRLIWFLDIVTLARENRGMIDFDKIDEELRQLQLSNIASEISRFCKEYIDSDFPFIKPGKKGWNNPFQKKMVSLQLIYGQISRHQNGHFRQIFFQMLSPALFHLIADPQWQTFQGNSSADRWLTSSILHTFNINNRIIRRALIILLHMLIYPSARLVQFLCMRFKKVETEI